jgi:hypothetical protein
MMALTGFGIHLTLTELLMIGILLVLVSWFIVFKRWSARIERQMRQHAAIEHAHIYAQQAERMFRVGPKNDGAKLEYIIESMDIPPEKNDVATAALFFVQRSTEPFTQCRKED